MRILFDECMPRGLRRDMTGHRVRTVQEEGWAGLRNGELLDRASRAGFEVFLTLDRGLMHQRITNLTLAVVVIRSTSNDIVNLRPIMPSVLKTLEQVRPGETFVVES